MYVQEVRHFLYAGIRRLCPLPFHRPDKNILRRMLHINELQQLRVIACLLQQVSAQRVRQKGRHPFFYQSVFEGGLKNITCDLPVHLMLTAGNGQDNLRIPAHGLIQSIIRSRITGMQRDHHIHLFFPGIIRNITLQNSRPSYPYLSASS